MYVKEAKTDTVSGSAQPNGDEREKHHTLTYLVIATLPSASKESIKQGDLSWTAAQGRLPRELVFE